LVAVGDSFPVSKNYNIILNNIIIVIFCFFKLLDHIRLNGNVYHSATLKLKLKQL